MRWLAYFILAYLVLGLQIGVADYLSWHGAAPNLGLLAVIFIALHAPRDAALLGSFSLGLLQDLLSAHPPGLFALSYGIVGLMCVQAQQLVYRESPLMHAMMALLGGLITATVLALHVWVRPAAPNAVDGGMTLPPIRVGAGVLYLSAVYTAILSPLVLWGLGRLQRLFAFQGGFRRRGW